MSRNKNTNNTPLKDLRSEKYQLIKTNIQLILISVTFGCMVLGMAIGVGYIGPPDLYILSYPLISLFLLFVWLISWLVGTTFQRFRLAKNKDRILAKIREYPKKLKSSLYFSYIIFLISVIVLFDLFIFMMILMVGYAFSHQNAFYILIKLFPFIPFLVFLGIICGITSLPRYKREVLLGCISIKSRKTKWGFSELYKFKKLKEILSATSKGRRILVSLPLERIFIMWGAQLDEYKIRSKNLEKLVDDTIEYVLYPEDFSLSFFNKLKVLWDDLWEMERKLSGNGFDVEAFVKVEKEKEAGGKSLWKKRVERAEDWIIILLSGIISSIVASLLLKIYNII